GASDGAGLGNQFLANIREANAICQVIRVFDDPDVVHVDGAIDPSADIATINTELSLADIQTQEKALPRMEDEAETKKENRPAFENAKVAKAILDEGRTLFSAQAEFDMAGVQHLNLLTTKPFLYVFNADEGVLTDPGKRAELAKTVAPADAVFLDAKVEAELLEMDDEESVRELLE